MEQALPTRRWAFVQWALLVIVVLHLVQAVVGFIAEPTFEIGPHAPTAMVAGMDYNGWHALAGVLLFGPGLVCVRRRSWSVLYLVVAGLVGIAPGIWVLFSPQVLLVLHLPHTHSDAIVHIVTGLVMIAIAGVQVAIDGGWRRSLADLRAGQAE